MEPILNIKHVYNKICLPNPEEVRKIFYPTFHALGPVQTAYHSCVVYNTIWFDVKT